METPEDLHIWSNTDFPYMCLKDEPRTNAFKNAISIVVKKGDVVIDIGSGSGILALFAANAGAQKVYAVEIDHVLADALRQTVKANGLEKTIEVIESDATTAELPKNADVVLGEIIETGLIDEMQVPVMNLLRERGVIGPDTTVLPEKYQSYLECVYTNHEYYGFKILAPKHEWPFYENPKEGWYHSEFEPVSEKKLILEADFNQIIDPKVSTQIVFERIKDTAKPITAIRLSGIITLCEGVELGPTNALNGDKIFPIDPAMQGSEHVKVEISYEMGSGYRAFNFLASSI